MKTLNLIFSSLFLLWCIIVLFICNTDPDIKKTRFNYGLGENGFNYIWELIILATFFNILARIFNQCNFYLVGAFGFIVLILSQLVYFFIFIKHLFNGFQSYREKDEDIGRFIIAVVTFPFIIFGILSSLCCYQTKIHQRINRTQSKLQKYFLQKMPLTNYQNIISIFNVMVSFSILTTFLIVSLLSREFEYLMLMLLSPIVLTILYFMAIKFGKKFLYQLTAFCWFLLTVLLITFYFAAVIYSISQNSLRVLDDLIVALFFVLILVIHSVIGFLSTLSLLQKVHAKVNGYDGNTFENQNFVALQELDYLNVNHQIEHPNIYPQIFTL